MLQALLLEEICNFLRRFEPILTRHEEVHEDKSVCRPRIFKAFFNKDFGFYTIARTVILNLILLDQGGESVVAEGVVLDNENGCLHARRLVYY